VGEAGRFFRWLFPEAIDRRDYDAIVAFAEDSADASDNHEETRVLEMGGVDFVFETEEVFDAFIFPCWAKFDFYGSPRAI